MKYLADGMLSVETRKGTYFYEIKVLVFMLVKLYGYSMERARKMCWGYGLDQRPKPAHRARSCLDTSKDGHSKSHTGDFHDFPSGFSFAVRDKYNEYKKMGYDQDFR